MAYVLNSEYKISIKHKLYFSVIKKNGEIWAYSLGWNETGYKFVKSQNFSTKWFNK